MGVRVYERECVRVCVSVCKKQEDRDREVVRCKCNYCESERQRKMHTLRQREGGREEERVLVRK